MKKKTSVLAACAVGLAIAAGAAVKNAWKKPITKETPYVVTLNRPELRLYRNALLKGNEWALICSPETAARGLGCIGEDCTYGLQALSDQVRSGKPAFYYAYSDRQRAENPEMDWVGFYHLGEKTQEKKPYVVMIAGGGFTSVCTMWESLPVSAAFRELGYQCFCIQYRTHKEFGKVPSALMEDLAACIRVINDHAEDFGVLTEGYLMGGFSAGGMMASLWGDETLGWKKFGLPKPGALALIYGVREEHPEENYNVPTFCRYCIHDQYFTDLTLFDDFRKNLEEKGIPTDFKGVDCKHGFGLGTGTEAEGWVKEAEVFWKERSLL